MTAKVVKGMGLGLLLAFICWPWGVARGVETGQFSVLVGPSISIIGVDGANKFGAGAHGGLAVGLSDSFRLMGDGGYLHILPGDDGENADGVGEGGSPLFRAGVSVEYLVDVITWIPFLTGGVDLIWVNGTQVPALVVGAGVDYQRWRAWSVGCRILYHGILADPEDSRVDLFPSLVTLNINLRRIINPF